MIKTMEYRHTGSGVLFSSASFQWREGKKLVDWLQHIENSEFVNNDVRIYVGN